MPEQIIYKPDRSKKGLFPEIEPFKKNIISKSASCSFIPIDIGNYIIKIAETKLMQLLKKQKEL